MSNTERATSRDWPLKVAFAALAVLLFVMFQLVALGVFQL